MSDDVTRYRIHLFKAYKLALVLIWLVMSNLFISYGFRVIYHFPNLGEPFRYFMATLWWLTFTLLFSWLAIYTKEKRSLLETLTLSVSRKCFFWASPVLAAMVVGTASASFENQSSLTSYGVGMGQTSYSALTFTSLAEQENIKLLEQLQTPAQTDQSIQYYVFYKPNCPYCQKGMQELFQVLSAQEKEKIAFVNLTSTGASDLAGFFNVTSAAQVIRLEDGIVKQERIAMDDDKGNIIPNQQLIERMKEEVK